jgi:glutamate synthase domain-containing protein 2/nitrite reductase/ring-hydroxylating ferredoxin subunit
MKNKTIVADFNNLEDKKPAYGLVSKTDLVIIKYDDNVSVFYGRCLHRGALLSDGYSDGNNLICGVHNWDYRLDTGISEYNNEEKLHKFSSIVEDGKVFVDEDEIKEFENEFPPNINRDEYLGLYESTHPTPEEDKAGEIHHLAKYGLLKVGHHGFVTSMGVGRNELPKWDDIQILPAQLARLPHLEDVEVGTNVIIGKTANKPLELKIPLFVSDMSYGALSEEAKISLAKGAELAGTGICSGEGGMLPEEQAENSRYFYELASAKFGFEMELLKKVQAFHFKGGQGAKTGTGGHLPADKNRGKISKVRGLPEGTPAISPPRFADLTTPKEFKSFADEVRKFTGGIPIGFKLSANHIEEDIDAAIEIGVDYIILDGRGGATGAAPALFRDNISVPTIPALARARNHLNKIEANDITLIITGGLRTAPDFIKAMALGADAIAVSNSALQAIGCQAMRACNTNFCPVGIATQKESLRSRININLSAKRLENFFNATVELMQVMARACGHDHLSQFCKDDIATFDRDMAYLTGIKYGGAVEL